MLPRWSVVIVGLGLILACANTLPNPTPIRSVRTKNEIGPSYEHRPTRVVRTSTSS